MAQALKRELPGSPESRSCRELERWIRTFDRSAVGAAYGKMNLHNVYANGQQVAGLDEAGKLDVISRLTAFSNSDTGSTQVTVQAEETLRGLAQRVYGNANLWYVIAEANALTDEVDKLPAGITLTVPEVKTSSNDASTFKPYNPSEITGPTSPGLPYIEPPDKGCGTLGMIIMVVIAVVVAVYLGPVATQFFSSAVAGGAVAGAASAAVSMAAGSAMGVASFSWQGVAAGAITGAITAGITSQFGTVGEALKGTAGVNGAAAAAPNIGKSAALALANAGANYAGQKLAGVDVSFSWNSIAASAVSSLVAAKVAPRIVDKLHLENSQFAYDFATGMAGGVVSAAVRSSFGQTLRQSDYMTVVADAFGNALGNAITRSGRGSPARASESEPTATGAVTEAGFQDSASVSVAGRGEATRSNAIEVRPLGTSQITTASNNNIATLETVTAVFTPETQEWADYWRGIWNTNTWNNLIGKPSLEPSGQVSSWSRPPSTPNATERFMADLQSATGRAPTPLWQQRIPLTQPMMTMAPEGYDPVTGITRTVTESRAYDPDAKLTPLQEANLRKAEYAANNHKLDQVVGDVLALSPFSPRYDNGIVNGQLVNPITSERISNSRREAAIGNVLEVMTLRGGLGGLSGKTTTAERMAIPDGEFYSVANTPSSLAHLDELTASRVARYAEVVNSNKPWAWGEIGEGIGRADRRLIRSAAEEAGSIPKVPVDPVTGAADFSGVLIRQERLPELYWTVSDRQQFNYLDQLIGGRPIGTTWHHDVVPGNMQLVPFGPHNITSHTGGRTIWSTGPR